MEHLPHYIWAYKEVLYARQMFLSKKAPRATKDGFASKAVKISCAMAKSWCILESLGRNPDCSLSNELLLSKTHKCYQIETFQMLLNKLVIKIQFDNCQLTVYYFLCARKNLSHFPSARESGLLHTIIK